MTLAAGSLLWLSACSGGGESGAGAGLPAPPPAAPEPPPPQGPLTGDSAASAKSAIQDVDAGDSYSPAEVSVDPDGGRVVRTKIEILFRDAATVGQANALLAGIGARITSSIAGQRWVVVRIPDPGTLDALDALVARIEAEPFVWFVRRSVLPDTSELPENVAADAAEGEHVRHHLAVGAAGAWAARNAIVDFPRVIVMDYFGDGPPDGELDYNYVGSAATDFATGALHKHGYHVAGIIAGKFGGPATPRGRVTGMMPGLIQLSVVDLQKRDPLDQQARLLMQLRSVASGTVVVNTSLGWSSVCDTRTTCFPLEEVRLEAASWIEKVRTAGLEGRFLHVSSAGNFVGRAAELGVRDARYGYFSGAASLLTDLVDAAGNPVAPLTNVLMVENVRAVAEFPFAGPRCVSDRSYEGGHVGGIGAHVWSFTDAGSGSDFDSGTSMAAPQVAGLAAYLLAIRPELTPQDLVKILRDTAAPVPVETDPDCSSAAEPAPIIQAHAALLALDRPGEGLGQLPVRLALLDIDGNGAFTETDLEELLRSFETAQGGVDFGRADLNNDARTGGDTTRPFDLDADGTRDGRLEVQIDGRMRAFNETGLTDAAIACYYAYSSLYAGDESARDLLLQSYFDQGQCGGETGISVSVQFPEQVPRGFGRPLVVTVVDAEGRPLPGAMVDLTVTGGRGSGGSTDGEGRMESTLTMDAEASAMTVRVVVTAPDGQVLYDTVTTIAAAPLVGVQIGVPLDPRQTTGFLFVGSSGVGSVPIKYGDGSLRTLEGPNARAEWRLLAPSPGPMLRFSWAGERQRTDTSVNVSIPFFNNSGTDIVLDFSGSLGAGLGEYEPDAEGIYRATGFYVTGPTTTTVRLKPFPTYYVLGAGVCCGGFTANVEAVFTQAPPP